MGGVATVDGAADGHLQGPLERWSGEDLALALGRPAAGAPSRRWSLWLAERIRALVRDEVLGYGAQLPASRALGAALGVSRGVVVSAYEQLLAEGFLAARQGSGTYVAVGGGSPEVRVPPSVPPPHARPGLPDLGAFPRTRWLAAYRAALAGASTADIGYGDPRGHPRLRVELAAHLGRTRAAVVDPDNVLVVGGVALALALLADVLVAAGRRRVVVEDPASPGTCELLRRRGLRVVPVPVDGDGIRPDALAAEDCAAVVLTAAHQYPTGVLLSAARRRALIALARERGFLLVEDDYDGAFHYGRGAVGCMQGLAPDVTMLLGSVSKTLAPSLRIGWLVAPPGWVAPLMRRRSVTDLAGPTIDQLAFAHLMASGGYDRHVRRMRRLYLRRRQRLVRVLAEVPWLTVRGAPSGLHVLAQVPGADAEAALCAALREAGFDVQGLAECHAAAGAEPGPAVASGVVIGFASLPDASIDKLGAVAAGLPASGW